MFSLIQLQLGSIIQINVSNTNIIFYKYAHLILLFFKESGMSDSTSDDGDQTSEKDKMIDPDFVDIEYLDQRSPSFEDVTIFSPDGEINEDNQDLTQDNAVVGSSSRTERSQINMTINVSANEFKNAQFHFTGVLYVRSFKTQHLADPVCSVNIFGSCESDLMKCLWENVKQYLSREVIVVMVDNEKQVKWSSRDSPSLIDLPKFVLLKHGKTKKMYTTDELHENSKLLASWRGKEIQVHVFKYSTSITSHSLWEVVNKQLLHPEKKDRAGAPSSEELFDCVNLLKEKHSHYTALWSSWEKWANFILAQPGDRREKLMIEAPPDDYLHLFRAPAVSESNQLQVTRQGLKVAFNINESLMGTVNSLCEKVDSLAKCVSEVQIQIHELKAEISNSRSLLDAMQTSFPPVETEFSRRLASRVTDSVDIDHTE